MSLSLDLFRRVWPSWTGIFGWILPLDSNLDLDLHLDLEWTRSRVVLSFLENATARRLSRAPSHLVHLAESSEDT